jgi:hypothetical protein
VVLYCVLTLHQSPPISSADQILIGLAVLAILVAILIAIIPPIRRWILYLSRPLTITHSKDCVELSPDPSNPWQQVRLKVGAKALRPVKKTSLSLMACSDPQVLTGQELKLKDDNLPHRPIATDSDRTCSWRKPEVYDFVLHRPGKASTIEFRDEGVRQNYGKISRSKYPTLLRIEVEATGLKPDKTSHVRATRATFLLEIERDGRLNVFSEDEVRADAVLEDQTTPETLTTWNMADGQSTAASAGYYVALLSPTDEPAGPTGAYHPEK